MRARIGDVVAGSGAVLMAVALAGLVIGLWSGVAPGPSLTLMLTLGAVGVAAGMVRRFEDGTARQLSCADSLLDIRQRRAELILREQAEDGTPRALNAV